MHMVASASQRVSFRITPLNHRILSTENGILGVVSILHQGLHGGAPSTAESDGVEESFEYHRDHLYTLSDGKLQRLHFVMRRLRRNPGYWTIVGPAIILDQNTASQAHTNQNGTHPNNLINSLIYTANYVLSEWPHHKQALLQNLPLLSTTEFPPLDTTVHNSQWKDTDRFLASQNSQLFMTYNMMEVLELYESEFLNKDSWNSLQVHPSSSNPDVDNHDTDCGHVECNFRQPIVRVSSPRRSDESSMPPTDDVSNTGAGYHDLYKLMTNSEAEWIELSSGSETSSSASEEENTTLHATSGDQAKSGKCNCRFRHSQDAEKPITSCSSCRRRHLKRKRREATRTRRLNRAMRR
jgi:hypothetical protein